MACDLLLHLSNHLANIYPKSFTVHPEALFNKESSLKATYDLYIHLSHILIIESSKRSGNRGAYTYTRGAQSRSWRFAFLQFREGSREKVQIIYIYIY